MSPDQLDIAAALFDQGKVNEALEITSRVVALKDPSHFALALHSSALKACYRHDEALEFDREAVRRYPADTIAWHNLATTLGDIGRGEEALEALAQGFSLGLDTPFSWAAKARAHVATGDAAEADAAFRRAVAGAPQWAELAIEYADLLWMASGDLARAQAVLDGAFHAGAPPVPLLLAKAKLIASAGGQEAGAALLLRGAAAMPHEVPVLLAAAQAALELNRLAEAEQLARDAAILAPDTVPVFVQLVIVHLAQGRPEAALAEARRAVSIAPEDQSALAWTCTAARAAGDPLYKALCDYEEMVGVYDIEAPEGWSSQAAFLRDLAAALDRHHVMREHPVAMSLRNGTQTTYRLTGAKDPAIRAFFAALDKPIRQHLTKLGAGTEPLRRRNSGGYRFAGAWSVRLRSGGFHLDHMHNEGWLSSASYIELPDGSQEREPHAGWLRLGQPPYVTEPPLPAERFIQPKPGRLVLFPSYMWHGTVPFEKGERRTTIAFDLLPA